MPGIRTSAPAIAWREAVKTLEARGEALFGRIATSPWTMPALTASTIPPHSSSTRFISATTRASISLVRFST